jgi:hypothetical protein
METVFGPAPVPLSVCGCAVGIESPCSSLSVSCWLHQKERWVWVWHLRIVHRVSLFRGRAGSSLSDICDTWDGNADCAHIVSAEPY